MASVSPFNTTALNTQGLGANQPGATSSLAHATEQNSPFNFGTGNSSPSCCPQQQPEQNSQEMLAKVAMMLMTIIQSLAETLGEVFKNMFGGQGGEGSQQCPQQCPDQSQGQQPGNSGSIPVNGGNPAEMIPQLIEIMKGLTEMLGSLLGGQGFGGQQQAGSSPMSAPASGGGTPPLMV